MKRCLLLLPLLLWLASCATPEPAPAPVSPAVSVEPEPSKAPAPVARERIQSQPLKHLPGRRLKPIPDKPLDVRTRCSFRDVQGGRGSMDLQVVQAEVRRFVAEVTIPREGVCRFDMKTFRQTEKLPNVVLTDGASACVVRMWEQESGVTVAFNGCQSKCSGDAFSYLWPILVDARNGRCS